MLRANLLMLAPMLAHVGFVPSWRYFALPEMGLRHKTDNVILQVKKCEVSLFQNNKYSLSGIWSHTEKTKKDLES